MKPQLILFVLVAAIFGTNVGAKEDEEIQPDGEMHRMPLMIGDTKIVSGNLAHRTGLVLDEEGTVYILSVSGASHATLFRISKKNTAKQLILYRGWPYLLDNHGRLMAFDASWYTSLRNKFPYLSMRFVKTAPLAVGVGLSGYFINLIDGTFLGLLPSRDVQAFTTILGGVLVFYGLDIGNTILNRSHRAIDMGSNFFTLTVAKGVSDIVPHPDFDDYLVETKAWRKVVKREPLSLLIPHSLVGRSCAEYLTRLSLL
ncbi:MAG: hypothetical protein KF799_10645 [Bdellovibrionales bacterium]|nr:hypothetical protein [Bdellovibrionales bacterium]